MHEVFVRRAALVLILHCEAAVLQIGAVARPDHATNDRPRQIYLFDNFDGKICLVLHFINSKKHLLKHERQINRVFGQHERDGFQEKPSKNQV